eukprot:10815537-Heterocapsa_arctica.AAC.1
MVGRWPEGIWSGGRGSEGRIARQLGQPEVRQPTLGRAVLGALGPIEGAASSLGAPPVGAPLASRAR